jgi:hypothetical protein
MELGQSYYGRYEDRYLENAKEDLQNKYKSFESLSEVTANTARNVKYIAHKDLTRVEKRVLKVLDGCDCWDGRKFRLGVSSGYAAWTDGHSYITIDKSWLKSMSLDWEGDIAHLFGVMAHELAHDSDTSMTDIHGEDFYKNYHDITERRGSLNPFTFTMRFKDSMRLALNAEQKARNKAKLNEELREKAQRLGMVGNSEKTAVAASNT